MKPKKSLGQNFLTSIPARNAIINSAEINIDENILEIGPGKGVLTEGLLKTGAKVIAVEKDKDLIEFLNKKFSQEIKNGQFVLLNDDILKLKTEKLKLKNYKIVANIPYYITGAIFEKFLTNNNQPKTMVVLIQKEVAIRIVAKDKKESILSLSVKIYGNPSISYKVDKGSFFPKPKVDSAVLCIKDISRNNFVNKKEEEIFFLLIKKGFAHKRKILINNLKETKLEVSWGKFFKEENIDLKSRAEDLELKTWILLSKKISNQY